MNNKKLGIETHQWGYFYLDRLIATCIAKTYWEAESYFEEIELTKHDGIEIRIITKLE